MAKVFCQRLATIIHLGLVVWTAGIVTLIGGPRLVLGTGTATGWMA